MKINVKRLFDIFFSFLVIFLMLPILLIVYFLIILIDRQNPFFIQERSGVNGISFKLIKFQTMKYLMKNSDELFITKLGLILRKSKLDEIPQFFNVLLNQMSVVGPRPLYLDFNNFYKSDDLKRLSVKPGITGLAQIMVVDATDWKRKFRYDRWYILNYSFKLDLIIIYLTIKKTISSALFKKKHFIETVDYKESFFSKYK
jgi:undecaprenyl phosphate N,N'-diacetylbacillosamine 1-phosphate transferase